MMTTLSTMLRTSPTFSSSSCGPTSDISGTMMSTSTVSFFVRTWASEGPVSSSSSMSASIRFGTALRVSCASSFSESESDSLDESESLVDSEGGAL